MNAEQTPTSLAEPLAPRSVWFWPVLGLAVLLSFPYYFSLETFFSHDDFALLWFHKDVPIWQFWRFFSTDVLANDYRPLPRGLLAVLWAAFGTTVFPYNFLLVSIHIGNVVLFGYLVHRLFQNLALTLFSVILFATNWEYCDVVFWKGTYSTAICWTFTLAAAAAFAGYRIDRRRRAYVGALAFFLLALLSKESAINVPPLLTLIGLVVPAAANGGGKESEPIDRRFPFSVKQLLNLATILAPFYLLAVGYVIFHQTAIRDVYGWLPKGYEFAGPVGWIQSLAHATTHWFTAPISAAEGFLFSARTRYYLHQWFQHPDHFFVNYFIPLLALGTIALLRDRRLVFGLGWAAIAFFPANLMQAPDYHTPRFYYGSLMGVAVFLAALVVMADVAVARRGNLRELIAARILGSILILVYAFTNLFQTTMLVSNDARNVAVIEDLYRELVSYRGRVPKYTLFRVHGLEPALHFHEGMGLREMFKLALEDDTAEAILPPDQQTSLSQEAVDHLQKYYPPPVEIYVEDGFRFQPPISSLTTGTLRRGPTHAPASPGSP